jgi:hypothetical protein
MHTSFYIHKHSENVNQCEETVEDKAFIPVLTEQKATTPTLTIVNNIQWHNLAIWEPWNGTVGLNVAHKIYQIL